MRSLDKVARNQTVHVRDFADAMQRLRDQHTARVERANADYFDGVKSLAERLIASDEKAAPNGETATPPPADGAGEQAAA